MKRVRAIRLWSGPGCKASESPEFQGQRLTVELSVTTTTEGVAGKVVSAGAGPACYRGARGSGTHLQALPRGTREEPGGSRRGPTPPAPLEAGPPGVRRPALRRPAPLAPRLQLRGHRVREAPAGAAPIAALLTGHGSPGKHHARRSGAQVSGQTQAVP